MDRKEFFYLLGLSAASATLGTCMPGCKKSASPDDNTPANVDFTLDLTSSEHASLNTKGVYLYRDGIIIAQSLSGAFIAVSKNCTHENYPVSYDANTKNFNCSNHGSSFSENGSVRNGPASRPLKQYKTSLNGSILRIYS